MPFYTYNPSNSQILHYDFLNWNVFATFRSSSLTAASEMEHFWRFSCQFSLAAALFIKG